MSDMPSVSYSLRSFKPSLSLILLVAFLMVLWLGGGTSRTDQLAQPIVRGAAWLLLIIAIAFDKGALTFREKPVWLFLAASAAVAFLQLIPLPPTFWEGLPGRKLFVEAAALTGNEQPWRSLAIVPSAALNALSSLIVPCAVMVFCTGLRERERRLLPAILSTLVLMTMIVGLMQLSGRAIDNPFVDDVPGSISGNFANRNHFALFLAFGILLVPLWSFPNGNVSRWRWPAALGVVVLLFLAILATGSRAGMALGLIAVAICLVLVRQPVQLLLQRYPRWLGPALALAAVGLVSVLVALNISADRAASIHRFYALSSEEDMRRQALPTVWKMIGTYFPYGSGLGDFATVFQIAEPLDFLNMTYFNRAHDDFLEVVINAGLPGLLLLIWAFGWWLAASSRVWRLSSPGRSARPKVGSAMLLLVFLASAFDYPARTPIMMALIAIAALWLCWGSDETRSPLPHSSQRL